MDFAVILFVANYVVLVKRREQYASQKIQASGASQRRDLQFETFMSNLGRRRQAALSEATPRTTMRTSI